MKLYRAVFPPRLYLPRDKLTTLKYHKVRIIHAYPALEYVMSWLIRLSIVTSWSDADIVYNILSQIMRIITAELDLIECLLGEKL